jgi:hypothetical protein
VLFGVVAVSCNGGPAPDGALCRDTIHRLCNSPRCSSTSVLSIPDTGCEQVLQQRTGCDQESFEFTTPARDRFIECRAPLTRAGNSSDTHPDCIDVDTMLTECLDVTHFFQGAAP